MKKDFNYYKKKAKEYYRKGDMPKAYYYRKKAHELGDKDEKIE